MNTKRKQIRLQTYDYSSPGYYFVTICTYKRQLLFGDITNGKMVLNDIGNMIDQKINEMDIYENVQIDTHCVMPNHVHMIITIVGADPRVRPNHSPRVDPKINNIDPHNHGQAQILNNGQAQGPAPTINVTLGEYVKRFKTLTTHLYIENVKNNSWPPFQNRIWQRNYYEHIIRADDNLDKIRDYMVNNPQMWEGEKDQDGDSVISSRVVISSETK